MKPCVALFLCLAALANAKLSLAFERNRGQVGFHVGQYGKSQPLVIDPAISFATYLGTSSVIGNGSFSEISSIAVDAGGSVYVTGFTSSADFPVTAGAYDTKFYGACSGGNCVNAFVAKLNPAGTSLVYSTFLGGTGGSEGYAIAVDAAGDAYVAGITGSPDFPVTPGALRTTYTSQDGFLVKLDPTGAKLLYATFLGGGVPATVQALAISPSGDIYLAGQTSSPNFPILNAVQPNFGGGTCTAGFQTNPCSDAFVMHWRSSDMSLMYSTFLGGSSNDAASSIAADSTGNAYVAGTTYSQDFPIANALQPAAGGGTCASMESASEGPCPSAFVSKLNADGKIQYATYLGGKGSNTGAGIAVDPAGDAYVTGSTDALNFPVVNAIQATLQFGKCEPPASGVYGEGICEDAFIAKLNPQGSALAFSTYFGGDSGVTYAGPVAVDSSGNAYIAISPGTPVPAGIPITSNTLSPCAGGIAGTPALLAEFGPDGSLSYSALFGGTSYDSVSGLVLDSSANLYLSGSTRSGDFPATPSAYQPDLNGFLNGFVAKIDLTSSPSPALELVSACIVNAATYMNWADTTEVSGFVAAGEMISIYGNGLGPSAAAGAVLDSQGSIATTLAGVTVTFDGIAAPLLYVQANQVNAIVPFEIVGKQQTTIQLQYNGSSGTARMQVAASVPGVFTIGGRGQQIAAFNQDGTLNSPANPAPKGSIVSMWATGLGPLNQSYTDGEIVTAPLATLVNPPQIQVGGVPAQTQYLGQAPGLVAGAMQMNLIVPDSATSGPNEISIGNTPPTAATLSVR